jgi:DNA topoisomerase I
MAGRKKPVPIAGARAARAAGLTYICDGDAGLRRRRAGKGFVYLDPHGKRVRDARTLARIRALVIPPAWTDVWICVRADGHLQATGRDARGRKQYRYHEAWRAARDEAKFDMLVPFALALPELRRTIDKDMRARGLGRRKVLAALVRLLETTLIRVGNDEYARANASYGLTTLADDHVEVRGARVRFDFVGKSQVHRLVELRDRRLATIVTRCRDVPGPGLFQYYESNGTARELSSSDVNAYIREIVGPAFSAKCFRTWGATVYAARELRALGTPASERAAKRAIVAAMRKTSECLGNTPAVCRSAYVHPLVVEAFREGSLERAFERADATKKTNALAADEAAVLEILTSRAAREPAKRRASAA